MAAIERAPAASSARRCENRLAVASMRSPRGDKLRTRLAFSAPSAKVGPKASSASPVRRGRRRAAAACAARNGWPACPGRAARRRRAERRTACRRACARARLDRGARQPAGPQQHRFAETGDDGRFDADRRRTAVEDEIDAAVEVGQNVLGAGRRDVAGAIGGGRDHRLAECSQHGLRHLVVGYAHRDGIEAGRRQVAHPAFGGLGQHERQRPRPERLGELQRLGVEARERLAASRSTTWAISGLNAGRPLAS